MLQRNKHGTDWDAYIVVFSITDRGTFQHALEVLYEIRQTEASSDAAVILVANKSDLVRSRQISEEGQ